MKVEYSFLIDCLKSYVNGGSFNFSKDCDFDAIFEYAKNQQLGGIVYKQLLSGDSENVVQKEKLKGLEKEYNKSVFWYSNLQSIISKIEVLFTQNNIDFIIIKGLEVAKFYPQPFLRSMGDCDIVVKHEDQKKAGKLLESLGLNMTISGDNCAWTFFYNGFEFELHYTLIGNEVFNTSNMENFLADFWKHMIKKENSTRFFLDINFHFVFLITHLSKHFINCGAGFRQFLDLAFIQKNCQLDFKYIEESLIKLDLLDFAKICFSLIEKWFNVSFPIKAELDQDFYEESSAFIIENGVFGNDNEDNKNNSEKYTLSRQKNKFAYSVKRIFGFFFPSYKELKAVKYYSFVDGKPYLIPVAYVYRFFRMIFLRKTKDSLSFVKDHAVMAGKIDERMDKLKKWGLK